MDMLNRSSVLPLATLLLAACGGNGQLGTSPPTGPGIVSSVSIAPIPATLLTGDTIQLTATVRDGAGNLLPNQAITWSSSADPVATVSPSGQLAGKGQGTAIITASSGGRSAAKQFTIYFGRGVRVAGMAAFDSIIPRLMAKYDIPGGAIAVVLGDRLVLARGYGQSDREAGVVAEPDALFRVASLSKPITAVAILKLVEEGRLDIGARAFDMLGHLQPPPGSTVDPRLAQITVGQLLQHSGGWDRDATFDPMFRSYAAAEAVGAPAPASAETVIRWMRGQPLQFNPGSRYAYSNLGYAVLGRIIEQVTGQSYEEYVRTSVLAPMGISRMRLGRTRLAERLDGEVRYYHDGSAESVFPGEGAAPWPYGGFHLEAMDAHGGWVASTVDLLRFVTAVDGRGAPDLLRKATVDLMTARPASPLWTGSSYYYAMGWLVRPSGVDANWWHDGSLPGTQTLLVRTFNGLAWAALLNARGANPGALGAELDVAMWDAVNTVSQWPSHDLFERYP